MKAVATSTDAPRPHSRRRLIVVGSVLVGLMIIAFVVVPGYARYQVIKTTEEYTGSRPTLGRVSINPFNLAVTLRDFSLPDRRGERLFSFDSLYVDIDLAPLRRRALVFPEVRLVAPYLRALIRADRTINLQDVILADSAPAGVDTAGHDSVAVVDSATSDDWTIRIEKVSIVDGTLNFTDLSLTPNFAAGVEQVNGTLQRVYSDVPVSGEVDLQGKVDRYAPVSIRGQMNPLSTQPTADVTLDFQSIELTTFTPYAGKFAGYRIDKGKLTLELSYRLQAQRLAGKNHIVLDQLTLGEKVESPDATSLPVPLGIALLKDSKGVIDLDIPVEGDVDDPQFRVMPLVMKALAQVLINAMTSPFKLLGSLFGGKGDELSYVAFTPGSDTLAAAEVAKLDALARALNERPDLKLDVRGAVAPSLDRDAMSLVEVTPDALQQLALRRATRIKDRLVAQKVPQSRVFLQRVDTTALGQDGAVRIQLALGV